MSAKYKLFIPATCDFYQSEAFERFGLLGHMLTTDEYYTFEKIYRDYIHYLLQFPEDCYDDKSSREDVYSMLFQMIDCGIVLVEQVGLPNPVRSTAEAGKS